MSFRELRNFTEMMKSLGYHQVISVGNFRTANFDLVSDILGWMVQRLDPHAAYSNDVSSEDRRVNFLKIVAQIIFRTSSLKINIKQLYRADGYAVKELLKVASFLWRAARSVEMEAGDDGAEEDEQDEPNMPLMKHRDALEETRSLGSKIVQMGSKVHGLLGEENASLRIARESTIRFLDELAYNLESDDPHKNIEMIVKEKINTASDDIATMQEKISDLEADSITVEKKISRKANELERVDKRLRSLKQVKPAWQEEYDILEKELQQVYTDYVEKTRNLNYLELELQRHKEKEEERQRQADAELKRVRQHLKEEERKILRGEEVDDKVFDDLLADIGDDGKSKSSRVPRRPNMGAQIRPSGRRGDRGDGFSPGLREEDDFDGNAPKSSGRMGGLGRLEEGSDSEEASSSEDSGDDGVSEEDGSLEDDGDTESETDDLGSHSEVSGETDF